VSFLSANRRSAAVPAVLALLAVAVLYSYARMRSTERSLDNASQDLMECQQLVTQISELRKLPQFAALESGTAESLVERVEQAMQASELPTSAVVAFSRNQHRN